MTAYIGEVWHSFGSPFTDWDNGQSWRVDSSGHVRPGAYLYQDVGGAVGSSLLGGITVTGLISDKAFKDRYLSKARILASAMGVKAQRYVGYKNVPKFLDDISDLINSRQVDFLGESPVKYGETEAGYIFRGTLANDTTYTIVLHKDMRFWTMLEGQSNMTRYIDDNLVPGTAPAGLGEEGEEGGGAE